MIHHSSSLTKTQTQITLSSSNKLQSYPIDRSKNVGANPKKMDVNLLKISGGENTGTTMGKPVALKKIIK